MKNRYYMMAKFEGKVKTHYIIDTNVRKIAFSCKTEIEAKNLMDMLNKEEQYEDSFSVTLERIADDKKSN